MFQDTLWVDIPVKADGLGHAGRRHDHKPDKNLKIKKAWGDDWSLFSLHKPCIVTK